MTVIHFDLINIKFDLINIKFDLINIKFDLINIKFSLFLFYSFLSTYAFYKDNFVNLERQNAINCKLMIPGYSWEQRARAMLVTSASLIIKLKTQLF